MLSKPNQSRSRPFGTRPLWAVLLVLATLAWTGVAGAQLPIPPSTQFDLTGFLQEATVTTPGSALSGGTLKVNGHVVTVPANTIVILPANALTWQELFTKAPAPYTGVATGMALADLPTPLTTYEVRVVGNRVGDVYIAGLINISQQALNSGAGFINFIDYGLGEMRVGGVIGSNTTGTRVRINDPIGRYGRATTSPDVRFTVDPDNPTIMAGTGYPMCLPRVAPAGPTDATSDPQCPQPNRPRDLNGNPIPQFTTVNLTNTAFPIPAPGTFPDSTKQAPLEVGDFVTFAGTLVADCVVGSPNCTGGGTTVGPFPVAGTAATWIAAHTITNNIAIYTFQGSDPAYIMIDVSLIGTGGLTVIGVGEAAIRTRFEGMMTDVDPSQATQRRAHLYGIDLDPAGNTQDRDFGTIFPDPGPPNGAVKGRWRFRPPCAVFGTVPAKLDKECVMNQAGTFLPPPREVRAVIEGLQTQNPALPGAKLAANGIFYGQYHAPIGDYIFPENIPGTPIVENNFNTIPFLACGGYSSSGIAIPPFTPTLVTGALSPWPSNVLPNTNACINFLGPTVAATASPNPAISNQVVTLTATATGAITFAWTQAATDVPKVTLTNANTAIATFTAPTVAVQTSLHFTVNACNTVGCNSALVTVTVNPAAATDLVSLTTVEYRTGNRRLQISATDSVINPTVNLTLQPYQCEVNAAPCVGGFYNPDPAAGGLGNAFTNNGGGLYTITLVGAPAPACKLGGTYATPCSVVSVKAQSSLGGVGTSVVTRIRQ